MTKFMLGKTQTEIAEIEAQKHRERELAVQKENLEQQSKIIALHKVHKRNKIIIISVFSLIVISLIVFGTYNTFFKKGLKPEDVTQQITMQVNKFPADGLDNYIRDNCEKLFLQHLGYQTSQYESVSIDKNSVYISRVKKINNVLAEVYFSADVTVKELDTIVTDPVILQRLRQSGFAVAAQPTPEPTPEPTPVPTPTPEPTPVPTELPTDTSAEAAPAAARIDNNSGAQIVLLAAYDDPTAQDTNSSEPSETVPPETSEETTTAAPTETEAPSETDAPAETTVPDDEEINSISIAEHRGDEQTEYYILANGTVMQRGKTTTVRYNFYLPVEYYYNYDESGKTAVTSGYRPAADLNFYVLNDVHQTNFDKITINKAYSFAGIKEDEVNYQPAKTRVNAILADLYAGRDTSQSFFNYRTFNTMGASYIEMNEFHLYVSKNSMGYNAFCKYTIKTKQGFNYTLSCYLLVEPVGSGKDQTWKITAIT